MTEVGGYPVSAYHVHGSNTKVRVRMHRRGGGEARTTISQDVQTRVPVQLAFAKFLSKKKGNF